MALTPSTMIPLGTPVPDFTLVDAVSGRTMSLADFKDRRALLVLFICNHCPYVKHVQAELVKLGKDYEDSGAAIVAISANDAAAYPDDAPERLAAEARRLGYRFPFLHDETQDVARAFHAACTPDVFLYGPDLRLAYRGQIDDSRPGNGIPVTGKDLRAALDAILAGRPVPAEQKPGIGCNIKWRA
jgi:peroxiredoxin